MTLQGVTGHTSEDIDQSIVAKLCEKRLFIAERIFNDHSWSRIRHLDSRKRWVWRNCPFCNQNELILTAPDRTDDPFLAFRRSARDRIWQCDTVPKAVN